MADILGSGFATITDHQPATFLELDSGGGNNALYMKAAFSSITLTDLSEQMLEVSRQLNPDREHLQGDSNSTHNTLYRLIRHSIITRNLP